MSFSLREKLFGQEHTATIEVLGRQFSVRTLSMPEEVEVTRSVGAINTYWEYLEARKIPTLARGIVAIDGVSCRDFDEIKQLLRTNPQLTLIQALESELRDTSLYPEEVITAIYGEYAKFRAEFRQKLDALKKNSPPTNPAPTG